MKKFLFLWYILLPLVIYAQKSAVYSHAYGKKENPAIIFIHGGPRGNATLFEATTAQKLAEEGFFIIVYDRRGEGRSIDTSATFTFQEAIADLNQIYSTYKIKRANIVAHSFGGLVATLFAEQNPQKVNSLILAGALFSQQKTYDHILNTTRKTYEEKNDSLVLAKIIGIGELDKHSAEYRKECYDIASQNGYFRMPFPTRESAMLR